MVDKMNNVFDKEKNDEIVDIILDIICAAISIYVLDICLKNIVNAVFDIISKI